MTIGSLLSPFVASMVAKYLGAQFTLSLNTLGQKISADIEEDTREFLDKLRYFDVLPHDVWTDSQQDYRVFFSNLFFNLVDSGNIRIVEMEVIVCPCGVLEIPREHARLQGKAYSSCDGKMICKKCLGEAIPKTATFLTYRFPKSLATMKVLPAWINSEVTEFASRFSDSSLRISRLRNTGIVEQIESKDFFIDTDFFWSCYISYLERFSADEHLLVVTSNRTIRQALLSAWLRGTRAHAQSTILVTPILRYVNRSDGIETLGLPIEYLAKKESDDVRFMLVHALSWKMKESQIGSDVWYWIEHSRKPQGVLTSSEEPPLPTPNEFIHTVSASTAKILLSSLRKKRHLGVNETILYNLLF